MKKVKSLLAVLLAAVIIISLAACGGAQKESQNSTGTQGTQSASTTTSGESTAAELSKDPITLSIYGGAADPGVTEENNVIGKQIQKDTGITLEYVFGDADKFKVLAAGGDLPDIIMMMNTTDMCSSLISSGAVIPLDDLLASYGANIVKNIPTALKWSKTIIGNGKTYFLPVQVGTEDRNNPSANGVVGFALRWDLYKDIGSPEMKNEDDFLNVVKQIMDANPKTKDGKKVYGLSAWSDWGLWPFSITYPMSFGYANTANSQWMNIETGEIQNIYLKEDGIFWKSLNFWSKAYRMGILDPETFTMKSQQYLQKIANGELIAGNATFWQPDKAICGENAAMYLIPGPFPYYQFVYPEAAPLGWQLAEARAITSNCEYPERAMQLLNYLDSDDGVRMVYNGVKGSAWDVVDGKPQLIGERLKALQDGKVEEYKTKYGLGIFNYYTSLAASSACEDTYPVDLSTTMDIKLASATASDKDFAQTYDAGLSFPGQVYDKFIKSGQFKSITSRPLAAGIMAPASDVTTQTFTKADAYFAANLAKIVMTKTDEDFNVQKKKAIDDVKAMGLEKAQAEVEELYKAAQDQVKSFE